MPFLFASQCEQELLRAVDDQRNLTEEAENKCLLEENKLFQLEEQIKQAHLEVSRFPILLLSAFKVIFIKAQ